ncbi:MAG: tetraacyldisaccharide 4'-kinase [Rhodospirillales bacterium]|nr:tetraacyldisaccharide 4'-kinase [Rhodospirillales bacterium]
MRAPDFWYRRDAVLTSRLLAPVAKTYGLVAGLRMRSVRSWRAPVPVICVGNLVAGGAGKTPVAMDIGQRLAARGFDAHFLTRGYGGTASGPTAVDAARHSAHDVGDEPLLLARVGPTWVARDRAAGARAAISAGADVLVMDDGFQNPAIVKDLALIVVDGRRGFGNGRVLPAGPLREPVEHGLKRADAVAIIGEDTAGVSARVSPRPVLRARLAPLDLPAALAKGRPVIAFAGIADPDKFFRTVQGLGCRLVGSYPFPDHHPYAVGDLAPILASADRQSAIVLTTAKDHVRVPQEFANRVTVLPVVLVWDNEADIEALLEAALRHGR